MFRESLLCSIVVASAAAASVQAADIKIYGRVDTGLVYHNYGGDSTRDDTFTLDSGANTPTRIGLEGFEDISDTTKVNFRLESRFTIDTGAFNTFSAGHPSRMFGGQSTVGLINENWGEISFGRVAGIASSTGPYDLQWLMDAYGGGTMGTGNAPVNSGRHDNTITYRSPWLGPVQFTAQYSLKSDGYDEGEESTSDVNRFYDLAAHYNVGQLHLVAVYESVVWGHNQQISNGANKDRKVATFGGSYRFEPATVYFQMQYFEGLNGLDAFTANDKTSNIKGYGIYGGTEFWYGLSSWKSMVYWKDYELERETGKSYDGDSLGLTTKFVYRPSKTVDLYVGGGYSRWDREDGGNMYTDSDFNLYTGVTKYF